MSFSTNEWSTLKEVIVGTATGAKVPHIDKSVRTVNYADQKDIDLIQSGPYPSQVIEEANEDLETLRDFLQKQGVKVHRPVLEKDPEYYNYCPRDNVLVVKDKIIECPLPIRARKSEHKNLRPVFHKLGLHTFELIAERTDLSYNELCISSKDVLALTEVEPLFDAANILRDDENIYYLVSNTGNKLGAKHLQRVLGDSYTVWPIEGIYSYIHIDSTIALLRKGLMLLNPERVKSISQLPKPLQDWEPIWCPEPVEIPYYGNYNHASKWVNMNLFSINENLVVLEQHQTNLADVLRKYGIESALLPFRHQRTLGGGPHCVTLDIYRDNK
jgi:N-dimethylarginine dimethylaminohydrolase